MEAGVTFLFDAGPSDVFLRNAKVLGVPLEDVATIVLSHRHYDHSNGLKYLKGQRLICHPDVFKANFRKGKTSPIGMPMAKREAEKQFRIIYTNEPFHLSEHVIFLGGIPRLNNFEAQTTVFVDENGNDDFMPDDSGVAIKTGKGLVVISGCAHSGICNMVAHAIKVTGVKKVHAVIGGFHLKENNSQTKRTIEYLKQLNVEKVIPSHCTELPALVAFYKVWPFTQVKSGQAIHF